MRFIRSDEFKGMFRSFKEIVASRSVATIGPASVEQWTVRELLSRIRPDQIWKVSADLLTVITAAAAAGYWLGTHTPSSSAELTPRTGDVVVGW